MRISKSVIKSGLAAFVLLLSVMPEAGARTCFLPDSEDCGEGDTNVSDISDVGSCRYYNCKDAGYKNDNPYQECYVENTVNIKNNRVSCYAVRCKMSQTACEEKAAGTNKCCNRDVASGCYYVGTCPKECDRSVYSYDSEQTGDGWTCISCHDNKGTFYKCNYDKTCEEQGYATSCSDEQIAEEVTGVKGQNGEKCYTCKGKPVENKTCAEYAEAAGKTYITESDEVICEEVTGHNADLFNIIPREVAADGQCYECHLMTCHEYDSGMDTIDNIKCESGYYVSKMPSYIAADGQCYECLEKKIYMTIELETEACEDPGSYQVCVWSGNGYNIDYSTDWYNCSRNNPIAVTKDYKDCSYHHKSTWTANFNLEDGSDDFDVNNWTLPFELTIKITYKVPAIFIRGNCNSSSPTYYSDANWNSPDSEYAPRTVTMTFPKGSKYRDIIKANAIDYSDFVSGNPEYETREYYFDGKKVSGSRVQIGNVVYTVQSR